MKRLIAFFLILNAGQASADQVEFCRRLDQLETKIVEELTKIKEANLARYLTERVVDYRVNIYRDLFCSHDPLTPELTEAMDRFSFDDSVYVSDLNLDLSECQFKQIGHFNLDILEALKKPARSWDPRKDTRYFTAHSYVSIPLDARFINHLNRNGSLKVVCKNKRIWPFTKHEAGTEHYDHLSNRLTLISRYDWNYMSSYGGLAYLYPASVPNAFEQLYKDFLRHGGSEE